MSTRKKEEGGKKKREGRKGSPAVSDDISEFKRYRMRSRQCENAVCCEALKPDDTYFTYNTPHIL